MSQSRATPRVRFVYPRTEWSDEECVAVLRRYVMARIRDLEAITL